MKIARTGKLEDYGTLLFSVVSGSTSYNTHIDEKLAEKLSLENGGEPADYLSDYDVRGVFLPHPEYMYAPEQLEEFVDSTQEDCIYFSLKKFSKMLYNGIPMALEMLFSSPKHILFVHDEFKPFLEHKNTFVSKKCFHTFGSYAASQLRKMTVKENDFKRNKKRSTLISMTSKKGTPYDSKNAMHLIRLLEMAIDIFETNTLKTYRENREFLLSIRFGKYTLEEIINMSDELFKKLDEGFQKSDLPYSPDKTFLNTLMTEQSLKIYGMYSEEAFTYDNAETKMSLLPASFGMAEDCTEYLTLDPLTEDYTSLSQYGFFVPYHDWFLGFYEDEELKFEGFSLDNLFKFAYGVFSCNPKHLFSLFAPSNLITKESSFSEEFKSLLTSCISHSKIQASLKGFYVGNMKKMEQWEQLKEKHNELLEKSAVAKTIPKEYWEEQFSKISLEKKADGANTLMLDKQLKALIARYNEWRDLVERKSKLPFYPSVPKSTTNRSASLMGKFGYDTYLAAVLYQQLSILKSFMQTLRVDNISEITLNSQSILTGKFKDFMEFQSFIEPLYEEVLSLTNDSIPEKVDIQKFYHSVSSQLLKKLLAK